MKKQKKSRVETVGVQMFKGIVDSYYMTIPYDKKERVIPSSVECAYNLSYFDLQETVNMLRSL
jgi:hypothetical protein